MIIGDLRASDLGREIILGTYEDSPLRGVLTSVRHERRGYSVIRLEGTVTPVRRRYETEVRVEPVCDHDMEVDEIGIYVPKPILRCTKCSWTKDIRS